MWFPLASLALAMLVVRRTVEKNLSSTVDSLALSWLQQGSALPFIFVTLFFARFYWPGELSAKFWLWTVVYSLCCAVDLYVYFKVLSMADLSYVAPLLSLVAVTTIIGSMVILHQKPSLIGMSGAVLVVVGATLVHRGKQKLHESHTQDRRVLLLILGLIVLRAFFANIELWPLRESNSTTFNFYTSLLAAPMLLLIAYVLRRQQAQQYWSEIRGKVRMYIYPLVFIGVTYTANLTATYQAKLLSPTAGYVTAVKSAQVVPMVLIGAWFFPEKVTRLQ
jgi:uncharacterized membrane protein